MPRLGAFQIGRLMGIPIRIHVTFPLLVAWYALASARWGDNPALSVAFLLLVFVAVVLHELGHAWMARRLGVRTREILVYPMGGLARLENMPTGLAELWIALAGPAVNLVLFAALVPLAAATVLNGGGPGLSAPLTDPTQLIPRLAAANFLLFAFNLLPAFPMDGGRVLRALLSTQMSTVRATSVAATVGRLFAVGFGLLGLLAPNLLLVLIAWFVFVGAGQELATQRQLSVLAGGKARDAMEREFDTLAPQATLAEAARLLADSQQQDYPVIDAWNRVAGVLSRGRILEGLALRDRSAVLEWMDRSPATVTPDTPLVQVVERIRARSRGPILVLDDRRLVGMITVERLSQYFESARRTTDRHPAGA